MIDLKTARKAIAYHDAMKVADSYCTDPDSFKMCSKEVIIQWIKAVPDEVVDEIRQLLPPISNKHRIASSERLKEIGIAP